MAEKPSPPGVPARTGGLPAAAAHPAIALVERVNAALVQYRAKGFNVLGPLAFTHLPSFMIPVLKTVQIDLDEKHQWIYRPGGSNWGLGKPALAAISAAAGISWDWVASGRSDDGRNARHIAYRAVGHWIDFSGERVQVVGEYAIELDAREDELRRSTDKKARTEPQWMPGPDGKNAQRMLKPHEIDAWIRDKVEGELIQLRKHAHARSQTGAQERAVRWALGLRSAYTLEELKRPFIVPRLLLNADSGDPVVKEFLIAASLGSLRELYGARAQARAALPSVGQDLQTGEIIDLAVGEVIEGPADGLAENRTENKDKPATGKAPETAEDRLAEERPAEDDRFHLEAGTESRPDPLQTARTAWRDKLREAKTKEARLKILQSLMLQRGRTEASLTVPLKQFSDQDIDDYFEWLLKLEKQGLVAPA